MKELKNSVHKTFAILEYFTPLKPEWGVTELAKEIGSSKSTIYRFLTQLQSLGILDQNKSSEKYSLGLKLFELGNRVPLRSALIEKTHPALISVAQRITETVHIAVLKNHQVFYIDKVESPQGLKTSTDIGSYLPAYATGLGKVLLAYLPESILNQSLDYLFTSKDIPALTANTITSRTRMIKELSKIRAQEYALDLEECEVGLICVAVPIFNQLGDVIAALSASGPANRFKKDELLNYVNILREGADAIQEKIGNFKLL